MGSISLIQSQKMFQPLTQHSLECIVVVAIWSGMSATKRIPRFAQGFAHLYLILCSSQKIFLSYDLACGTKSLSFAENAEMVAVENYIDVGDILGKPCHPLFNRKYGIMQGLRILGRKHLQKRPFPYIGKGNFQYYFGYLRNKLNLIIHTLEMDNLV